MIEKEIEIHEKKSFLKEEDFPLILGAQALPNFSVHHSAFPHDVHISPFKLVFSICTTCFGIKKTLHFAHTMYLWMWFSEWTEIIPPPTLISLSF